MQASSACTVCVLISQPKLVIIDVCHSKDYNICDFGEYEESISLCSMTNHNGKDIFSQHLNFFSAIFNA